MTESPAGKIRHAQCMMRDMNAPAKHRHIILALAIALLFICEMLWLKTFTGLENRLSDSMLARHALNIQPDEDIVIIDIDERSLAMMAESIGRWPWPRSIHAELLAGIAQQNPQAVVFDILFSDADLMRPEGDAYFAEVIRNTDNTYFPMLRLNAESDGQGIPLAEYGAALGVIPGPQANPQAKAAMVLPLSAMLETNRLGTHNALADADGLVRRYPIYMNAEGWRIPSLPATLAKHLGHVVPTEPEIILNWHGRALSYKRVSYADVYADLQRENRQRPADEFSGKIIIIGATANGLHDVRPTPLAAFHSGVEILATAIDNLKNNNPLQKVPAGYLIGLGLALIAALAGMLIMWRRLLWIGTVLALITLALLLSSYLALNWHLLLPMLTLIIFAWTYYIFAALMEYIDERKTRERAVATFGRFLDPRVVQALVERGETTQSLSGKSQQISVLFSDIRGFTTLSESSTPEQVVELLNGYFTQQAGVVFRHEGTLDKYIGDAIMAFWGAPTDQPDHALRAVAAALEMGEKLEQFRNHVKDSGAGELGRDLDIGIGVHSGPAVVGFIGSDNRQDYTAIGDTVNLSSRIEGLTKGVARVLVSLETKILCEQQSGDAGCPYQFIDRGSFAVKGRAQPVSLFEPIRQNL